MEILVELKSVYGEMKVYPVCQKAQTLASIAGTTTLTPETIEKIKTLGYVVSVKPTEPARL